MNDSLNETSFQKPEDKLYFIKIGSRVKKLLTPKLFFSSTDLPLKNFAFRL